MEGLASISPPTPIDVLIERGVEFVVYRHEPVRTAEDIRGKTDLSIARSVKTIAFSISGDRLLLAAIPGPARIRYGRLAAAVRVSRSAMRPADPDALAALGMLPGGVSPVCHDPTVPVVIDDAIPRMDHVYCGSGNPDVTIELAARDLLAGNNVLVADIADPAC